MERRIALNVTFLDISPYGMGDKCYLQTWNSSDLSGELNRILQTQMNKFGK